MTVKDRQFWESAKLNNATFAQYYNRLVELAITRFEWVNLPDSVDARYLELVLFSNGQAVFFRDEVLGYLGLQCAIDGHLNVYNVPMRRRAYAANGYSATLDDTNSVIIFNNYLRTSSMLDVEMFARRLYNLDRAIDVNANAQKTPILISCDQSRELTLKNLYMKYDGNTPVIYGDKSINPDSLKVLQTGAPYVADKLYQLKINLWNEALSYLGISNANFEKRERLISDEVQTAQGATVASRYSGLEARKQAASQINKLFGLNIDVKFRLGDEDYQYLYDRSALDMPNQGES